MTPTLRASIELRNELAARPPGAWFTTDEAALYLGCARRTLRNHQAARRLVPDGRAARKPLFRKSTLDAFLASRAPTPPGAA